MASPNAVDAAVLATLASDVTLKALLPDGVFMDAATPGSTRFVVVQALEHEDEPGFNQTLYERYVYSVQAVAMATSGADVVAGSDRIDALLHRVPLTVAGYSWMQTLRRHRDRPPAELDAVDTDLRWQQRGGDYEVFVSPQ
jgi:hypothetical protein